MLTSWTLILILTAASWFGPTRGIRGIARVLMILLTVFLGLAFIWSVLLVALAFSGFLVGAAYRAFLRRRFGEIIRVYQQGQRDYARIQERAHNYYWDRVWARSEKQPVPPYDPELSRVYHHLDGGCPREIWRMVIDNGQVPQAWMPAAREWMRLNMAPPTLN